MSLAHVLVDRKRESVVWSYFMYLPDKGKSRCNIHVDALRKVCGAEIAIKTLQI